MEKNQSFVNKTAFSHETLSAAKYANWKCTETAHLLLISQHLRKYNGYQTPVSFSCTTLPQ